MNFTTLLVKQNNLFAHGATLREAQEALLEKLFDDMPEEERIEAFVEAHPDNGTAYPNRDLFDWHHRLTGSCEMGRNAFVKNHGLDMNGSTTVQGFIRLCEHDYGGSTIKKLRQYYKMDE